MNQDELQQNPFSLIADFDGDISSLFDKEIEEILPVLPLRNMMLFPGVVAPVSVGRESSRKLVQQAVKSGSLIAVTTQLDSTVETPTAKDLYPIGVVAKVMRVIELPDGVLTVILQSYSRFRLGEVTRMKPYMRAHVEKIPEILPEADDREYTALVDTCKDSTIRLIRMSDTVRDEAAFAIRNISNPIFLISFICTNLPFPIEEKSELLAINDEKERAFKLLSIFNRESQYATLKRNIQNRTREDLDQQQKEYFLQQQIKNIQSELGDDSQNDDVREIMEKAKWLKMPDKVAATFNREVEKLKHINMQSPDYNVQLNYLQTLVSLPWGKDTKDNLNIKNAERILNRDHYGMEKVKERILEHLAVLRVRQDMKAPILCLYGPPGVGKTSLGRSIAEALGRKYVRISLGGLHDEAEIRGHRRTYIGAMCGRIIQNLQKAGTSNPVFVLDEIDKVSSDFKGDPASALLEVLDPEQNSTFHDNYLDIDYDLSHVMFIATANNLNTISQPLLDRMELIEVSGYIQEEKIEIAARHLIPKEAEMHGLAKKEVKFPRKTIQAIIESYTRESGVRELDKKIAKVMRKLACLKASDEQLPAQIKPENLQDYLGMVEYTRDKYQGNDYAGVVTGLAWTAVGGEILFVETSLSKGKGGKLTLTGNLGDVMKESAMLALEYIHAHAALFDIPEDRFENWNVHVHVPEGAIPKDGPSAGITMVTSLVSAFKQCKVKKNLAMTGEITLRGKVLPVGGIREKILAAKRAGIEEIILCQENKKDIDEIKPEYLKGVTFHYVKDIKEVIQLALLDEKVESPLF